MPATTITNTMSLVRSRCVTPINSAHVRIPDKAQDGHKCATKKRGTKQCAICKGFAGNNKQKNCHHCAKNDHVVSDWLKAKQKTLRGMVCKKCKWSTKGNRKHFCGGCRHPFPNAMKKASAGHATKRKASAGHAKQKTLRGMVCKKCDWSTKGNRKHFCGGCGHPFPNAMKKASAGHATKRKKLKFLKTPPIVPYVPLEEFGSIELEILGFTLGSAVQDFLEMDSNVELPDKDFIGTVEHVVTDEECFEFFGSKKYKEGIDI